MKLYLPDDRSADKSLSASLADTNVILETTTRAEQKTIERVANIVTNE